MDIISIFDETLNWMLNGVLLGIQKVLELNYLTVTFFFYIFNTVFNCISHRTNSVFIFLQCSFFDFVEFINELIIYITFLVNGALDFIFKFIFYIYSLYSYIACVINVCGTKLQILYNCVFLYVCYAIEQLSYLLQLISSALLIILQLGPNLVILLYSFILFCISYVLLQIQYGVYFLHNNIYQLHIVCQNIIFGIPLKAYAGIILLIGLFKSRKLLSIYFKIICLILLKNFTVVILKCFCIANFTFMVFSTMLFTLFNKIKSWRRFCSNESDLNFEIHPGPSNNEQGSVANNIAPTKWNIFVRTKNTFSKLLLPKDKDEETIQQLTLLERELSVEKDRRLCIICQDRERNVILFPCRHLCVCVECTAVLQSNFLGCPLCRMQIFKAVHVYI